MERPKHLMISETDGHLYDTRHPEWYKKPLRTDYCHTFVRIETTAQLKATLRAGGLTFPGAYPMYLITSDGAALHFDCVRQNLRSVLDSIKNRIDDGWRVVVTEVNYEDELWCDHCNNEIESAYGE